MAPSTTVQPLPVPEGSKVNFGAVITGVDVENLTGKRSLMTGIRYKGYAYKEHSGER